VRQGKPWVHAGVVGSQARALLIAPGASACLRCLFPDPPPPGQLETCESSGVLGPAVLVAAGWQSALALRWLGGEPDQRPAAAGRFVCSDVWSGEQASLRPERDPACPCCSARRFEFLEQAEHQRPIALCGRNAVQVPGRGQAPDRPRLLERLERSGASELRQSGPLLSFRHEDLRFTLFPDGRCLVEGTEDPTRALAHCERLLL
jgi:adenylyltransferase/sulfurtransferase